MNTERGCLEKGKIVLACMALCGGIALASFSVAASQLTRRTSEAFDRYVRAAETGANGDVAAGKNFLWMDAMPQAEGSRDYARLRRGEVVVQKNKRCEPSGCEQVPGGLIHDWIGMVFVPGASLSETLAVLEDYAHDSEYYPAQVVGSKLIGQSGDDFHVYLRLRQVEIITVILDTEYDIRYTRMDSLHAYSRSYSTRIAEVEGAGTPREHDAAAGNDHGFLWRLNSYWRFYEADGGVYIQCEAISLTRDVPTGLGWLIGGFIERIPAESLRSTLLETRTAVLGQIHLKEEKPK